MDPLPTGSAPASPAGGLAGLRWTWRVGPVIVVVVTVAVALSTLQRASEGSAALAAGPPAVLRAVVNVQGASVTIHGPGFDSQPCTDGFFPNVSENQDCVHTFSQGDLVTLTATDPQPNTAFVGWSDDRCPAGPVATCTLALGDQETVVALFSPVTLTVYANGWNAPDKVEVTDSTGQTCVVALDVNAAGPCTFPLGSILSLVATGAAGQAPTWNAGDCDTPPQPGADGLSSLCTMTVTGDQPAHVGFGPASPPDLDAPPRASVTFQVSRTGAGSIHGAVDCGATCSIAKDLGAAVTVIADADPGSHFVRWDGGCGTVRVCRLYATGTPVTAVFAPDSPSPPASPQGGNPPQPRRFQASLGTATVTRHGRRLALRIQLQANAPASVRAKLAKGGRTVARALFPATAAAPGILGLALAPSTKGGIYTLRLTIRDRTGDSPITAIRKVRVPA